LIFDLPRSVIKIPENQEVFKGRLELPFSVISIPKNQEVSKGRLDLPFPESRFSKNKVDKVAHPVTRGGS